MRVVISESSGAIENTHRPANLYTCSFISFTIKNYITVTISLETGGGGGLLSFQTLVNIASGQVEP